MNSTDFWLQLQTVKAELQNFKAEATRIQSSHRTQVLQLLEILTAQSVYQKTQLNQIVNQIDILLRILPEPVLQFNTFPVSPVPSPLPSTESIATQLTSESAGYNPPTF